MIINSIDLMKEGGWETERTTIYDTTSGCFYGRG